MKRWTLLVAVSFVMSTAMAQDNPYIVKTKGVQREASANSQKDSEEAEPTDFMGKNFRYYSMCDWKEGMRFMVVPEKYDLLVNTFHDAATNKEVGNGQLRHLIMVYNCQMVVYISTSPVRTMAETIISSSLMVHLRTIVIQKPVCPRWPIWGMSTRHASC